MNADRRASVLIGECTSDIGVHVHRNAIFMCAPALPYVAACLTVAARPPELRRRSGAFGRRRERPPRFDASIGIAEGWHVHTMPPFPAGSLPTIDPCGKAPMHGNAELTWPAGDAAVLAGVSAVRQRQARHERFLGVVGAEHSRADIAAE